MFTNTSVGDYVSSWWDFGDGITSTLTGPTHTYTAAGTYTVTLIVNGPGGTDTEVKVNLVHSWEERRVYLPLILRYHHFVRPSNRK